MADPSQKKAAFVLSATLPAFTRIIRGKLDAMQAMMTGQLKVAGSMVYMMKNVPTVLRFVKCATMVDTEFGGT
jgi:putative sterol carrier protein